MLGMSACSARQLRTDLASLVSRFPAQRDAQTEQIVALAMECLGSAYVQRHVQGFQHDVPMGAPGKSGAEGEIAQRCRVQQPDVFHVLGEFGVDLHAWFVAQPACAEVSGPRGVAEVERTLGTVVVEIDAVVGTARTVERIVLRAAADHVGGAGDVTSRAAVLAERASSQPIARAERPAARNRPGEQVFRLGPVDA